MVQLRSHASDQPPQGVVRLLLACVLFQNTLPHAAARNH
jgi:hypothetical protein